MKDLDSQLLLRKKGAKISSEYRN